MRYQADEKPPAPLALGCGLQHVVLGLASIVLIPTIVIRAAGGTDAYLSWAVFSAVGVSGIVTALQAARLGRVGAGYVLTMGPAVAFIGVCAAALAEGVRPCWRPWWSRRRWSPSWSPCGSRCSGGC